ncbi:hypothetical protein INT48_001001, partial [Thamnidium elegans]
KHQAEMNRKITERGSFYETNSAEPIETKSRKFRWSSCFAFITKFKKNKTQKIRVSQSYEEYVFNEDYTPDKEQLKSTIQVSDVKPSASLPWKHQSQPTSSLSPPPRQTKSKRDSNVSRKNSQPNDSNNSRGGRRPLVDPTLTPRVKPRSIKTKKQPSLLRLSLDAELLQQASPDGVFLLQDNDSLDSCKAGHSSLSFTPTQSQPFRSGTLGAARNPKLSISTDNDVPPLPTLNIPYVTNSSNDNTRPNSQSTSATNNSNISYIADSPVSVSAVEAVAIDEEEKLTLKERRHRKSPLSMPDTEQLTLALKNFQTEESDEKKPLHPLQQLRRRRQSQQVYYDSNDDDEHIWRQQILEQSLAFSFQNKSRHEAMLTLEGKHSKGTTLQPIVNFHELDSHFENDSNDINNVQDVVKEKAQYDAVVSRTTMHRRHLSHDERKSTFNNNNNRTSLRARSPTELTTNEKKMSQQQQQQQSEMIITSTLSPAQQLGIITENEVATTTPISANKKLLFTTSGPHLSVTPETPPHHQQNAPSLISAPSTPNSIDSSVFDHDDYMNHERHPHLSLILSSAP